MMTPPIESLTGANSGQILIIEMVCYNPSTMSSTLTPVDISNMPALLDLVEEVEATKKPRALMRDNKPVALLTPIVKHKEKWEKIKATFGSWSDLDPDKL